MERQLSEIWDQAHQYYCVRLSEHERLQIEAFTSSEDASKQISALEAQYTAHRVVKVLRKAHPFIAQLRSFSFIINTFVQSDPKIAALVWGPLALILEVIS